jgi:hypothetical protein
MEATVDPQPRGPDWMPITPKTGSLLHADSQAYPRYAPNDPNFRNAYEPAPLAAPSSLSKFD